jgi:hypothetical protein
MDTKTKLITLIALIEALVIIYLVFFKQTNQEMVDQSMKKFKEDIPLLELEDNSGTDETKIKQLEGKNLGQIFDITPSTSSDQVLSISIDESMLFNIKMGDSFLLPAIDGETHKVQIDIVEKMDNDTMNIVGILEGLEIGFIDMNVNKNESFGIIQVNDNTYRIEIKNGKGSIYKEDE